MRKIALLVLWMFSVVIMLAQNAIEVRGVVVDSLSGEPLPYVRVGLMTNDSLQRIVGVEFTGDNGLFAIRSVVEGGLCFEFVLDGLRYAAYSCHCER